MFTKQVDRSHIRQSVIAVPPLARCDDLTIDAEQNRRLIRHIESGGVSTLLYGGNANPYHIAISEYAELLNVISDAVADEALAIPSVGPAYGTMMEQAQILGDPSFPTAMILPQQGITTRSACCTKPSR